MAFNFGNHISATDFQGGGFVASSPAAEKTPIARNGAQSDSLRALSIKQIKQATQGSGHSDTAELDGHPVQDIMLVGKVLEQNIQSTVDLYVVSDGTGKLSFKYFIDDETEALSQLRAACAPNHYIRVLGSLRWTEGEAFMNAYAIRPVTDHNEITYHNLNCIYQSLQLTRGSQGAVAAAPAGGMGAPAVNMNNNSSGFDACQHAVTELLKNDNSLGDAGMSIQQIQQTLAGRFNAQQVKDALRFLTDEGYIYTTTDDNHFRHCG